MPKTVINHALLIFKITLLWIHHTVTEILGKINVVRSCYDTIEVKSWKTKLDQDITIHNVIPNMIIPFMTT